MLASQVLFRLWVSLLTIFLAPVRGTSFSPALPSQLYKARPGGRPCVNCTTTFVGLNVSIRERIQLEKIKEKIMKGLGLDQIPQLKSERERQSREPVAPINITKTPEDVQPYQFVDIISKSEPPDGISDKSVLQFKVHEKKKGDSVGVTKGYLYVFLKKRGRKSKGKKRITLRISTVNENGKPKKLLTSLKMRFQESKWQKIGLPSDLLNEVLKNPSAPLRLHVRCKKCKKSVKPILVFKNSRRRRMRQHRNRKLCLNKKRPLLVIRTKTLRSRSKRHTLSCVRGPSTHSHPHNASVSSEFNNNCCKRSYYLNFTEIGWDDWIISPEGTIVSECNGRCSNRRASAAFHDAVSPRQRPGRGRRPRTRRECRPTRRAPLVMVYFDESLHVVQKRIPDMTITNCGCRQAN